MSIPTATRPFTLRDFLDLTGLVNSNGTALPATAPSSSSDPYSTAYLNMFSDHPGSHVAYPSMWNSQNGFSYPPYPAPPPPVPPGIPVVPTNFGHQTQLPSYSSGNLHRAPPIPQRSDSFRTHINPNTDIRKRPQLRRSNTVGASNIGDRVPGVGERVPIKADNISLSGKMDAVPHRRFSEEPKYGPSEPDGLRIELIRRLLMQPNKRIVPNVSTGPSPTERVMRKFVTGITSNLERFEGVPCNAVTSTSSSSYVEAIPQTTANSMDAAGFGIATRGGFRPVTSSSSVQRRCRLRREYTVDVGGPVAIDQPRSGSLSKSGILPNRTTLVSHPSEQLSMSKTQLSNESVEYGEPEIDLPDELRFTAEGFQGRTLVQWLCRQLVRTGVAWSYNLITLVAHICTCLMRLGVLHLDQSKPDNSKSAQTRLPSSLPSEIMASGATSEIFERFDLNQHYKWSGYRPGQLTDLRELCSTNRPFNLTANSMRSSQESLPFPSRFQPDLSELRKEYEYELERLAREHELQLFRVKNQGVMKVCQLTDRIEVLEQEVEKYRILAGIERLTKSPMLDENTRGRGRLNVYRYSDASEDDSRHSSADGRRKRIQRVGFSVPDAYDTSPPYTRATVRPRASSEVAHTSFGQFKLREDDRSGVTDQISPHPAPVDDLTRTKAFLRKFKDYSSSTTDSGLSGSKESRHDSRDTTQQSITSNESIEQKDSEGPTKFYGQKHPHTTLALRLWSAIDETSYPTVH
ncbi:hypothetical protein CRM22_010949 [Opisthorchis felineus]|uniref:Uncharacterized protein n=1 Tax=Opisthorchis felineus TaxID=147828 RepID=A0A4V3SAF1_OPIFE|nr:hypothetical protein CRM22_010949 [Opisthorchis felineus]TGZ48824.1 hypothetical protein CRM22_010949 [Opisthorchis felineus]TGZ48825.1 hypothetical protein CRM22_010949 [Opisthorchis felineus]